MAEYPNDKDAEKKRLLLLNHHKEKHFTAGNISDDVIIGVFDGLTVSFTLAAEFSGANASSSIILAAGIVEVAVGAISMGVGRYLAAKSKSDHYFRELKREQEEIITVPNTKVVEADEILSEYGSVVNALG